MNNYYDILGISPDAEAEVIAAAYKALMRKYHPDVNKSQGAQEKAQQINEAYSTLSSPNKRKEYDETLSKQGGKKTDWDDGRKAHDDSEHFDKEAKEFEEFQAFKRHQAYQEFRRHQTRQYWAGVAKDAATAAKENISRVSENANRKPPGPLNWEPLRRFIINATLFFTGVMLIAFAYAVYEHRTMGAEEANTEAYVVERTDYENSETSLSDMASDPMGEDYNAQPVPDQRVPPLGGFVDNIRNAVITAKETMENRGLSGARDYSRSCAIAAAYSADILKTDFCVAFDMYIAVIDHGVTSSSGLPSDSYFKSQMNNFEQLYARFSDASPTRVSLIWEDAKQYM